MNRQLTVIAFILLGFSSCMKEQQQPLTKLQINQKIDSILKTRIEESDHNARRDLEHRMKIEVKPMVDSIVNARLQQAAADTAHKKPAVQ